MLFRLTAAGKILFDTNPAAFNITRVVLTDAFGYTLADPPVALQGDPVYDVTATLQKEAVGANTMMYTKLLDNTVGDFEFGEAGLYSGATLALVGVSSTLITKTEADGAEKGNFINLNAFVSYNNVDSYGFMTLSNSDNLLAVGQVNSPDYLVPPYEGEPNAYVVNGLTPEEVPSFAFADRYGRWNFSSRPLRVYNGTVTTATTTALDIEDEHGVTFADASDYILQWTSGPLRGYVRQLNNIGDTFFAWNTPTVTAPEEGDEFVIVGPQSTTITVEGQADILFQDEGSALGSAGTVSTVNFVGAGIAASRSGSTVTVTVGGSVALQFQDEGSNLGTAGTVTTLNFVGTGIVASRSGNVVTVTANAPAPAPASQAQIQFQEEGSNLGTVGTVTSVNFVGAATATRSSNALTVTVPQAHAQIQFQDEGSNLGSTGTVNTINFTGSAVEVERTGDELTVDITGGGGDSVWENFQYALDGKFVVNRLMPQTLPESEETEVFVQHKMIVDSMPLITGADFAIRLYIPNEYQRDMDTGPVSIGSQQVSGTTYIQDNNEETAIVNFLTNEDTIDDSFKLTDTDVGRQTAVHGLVNFSNRTYVQLRNYDLSNTENSSWIFLCLDRSGPPDTLILWQTRFHHDTGAAIGNVPLGYDGLNDRLYSLFTSIDNEADAHHILTKFDGTTGAVIWQRTIDDPVNTGGQAYGLTIKEVEDDESLIFVSINETISAINADGTLAWQTRITDWDADPAGAFYVPSLVYDQNDDVVYASLRSLSSVAVGFIQLDPADGTENWAVTHGNISGRAVYLAVADSLLYFAVNGLSAGVFYGALDNTGAEVFGVDILGGTDTWVDSNNYRMGGLAISSGELLLALVTDNEEVQVKVELRLPNAEPPLGITDSVFAKYPGYSIEIQDSVNTVTPGAVVTYDTDEDLVLTTTTDMTITTPTVLLETNDVSLMTATRLQDNEGSPEVALSLEVKNVFKAGQVVLGDRIAPPTSSVGNQGDLQGMIRADATHMYYCIQDFNGSSDIWVRQEWTDTGTWP